VRDDHHVSGDVSIDRGRELVDELGGSPVQVAHGLATGRPRVRIGHPAGLQAGHGCADRRRAYTFEHSERALSEPGVGPDRQPEHGGEGGGGLQCAAQVAGVDRPDRAVAELPGGVRRLGQAAVGQLRQIVVPLRQARDVPGGLAVPDQPDGGFGARVGRAALVVHARQLGQSVLKNDENVNDFSEL
jgi:hypothetical protein